MTTKIEWVRSADGSAGKTWNPVTGCSKISLGCRYCYAERMAIRLAGRHGYPADEPFRVTLHRRRLRQPLHWTRPSMIFVCSMSDLFHDDIPDDFIFAILGTIKECTYHTFQILTKRTRRLMDVSRRLVRWPANVWIGATVEARQYKSRIADLSQIDASVRFLSCEPLLEDLEEIDLRGVSWVIVGGESGPRARPMQADWAIGIRDQCIRKKVPYFFKQWGGVRKACAGRTLEGREWNQMPQQSCFHGYGQMKLVQ
jgi:protein gp37